MVLRQLTKEQAKEEVKKLVDKYNRILESGSIKRYKEEDTKAEFIEPLFEALGWDVRNTENDDEVVREEKISKGRVDYSFRINGIPKFFLEAKALKEDLDNPKFVEQTVNYSWHKGCTWAVLTDFEAIKIFNAEWKSASPLQAQFGQTLPCQLFLEKFDTLWLLSRESFDNKLLDIEAEKWGKKVKKISVDKQLLNDLTRFRDLLNKNILKNNASKNLSGDDLDEAVQRIIDRLIFIRTLEDKELEAPMLQSVIREDLNKRTYKKLNLIFRKIDDIYNSKLFTPHLCEELDIDDEVLAKIINGLFNTSDNTVHYDFAAIDADVLGNIYEQYLGHILKKTDKRAKLAEGKVHRKEQGIYYTPTYVVDYIVKNTVGELAKDKKFDLKNIKILDPACGSGSFLMKAFDYLVTLDKKKNGEVDQTKLDLTNVSTTYGRKVEILKNNIFGVDLDPKAVEIAQLNLLLKAAEKKHRLPTLQENIRVGNSLIDDPNVAGDKAFKWEEQFKEIMNEGGFDVVIGNPPYVRQEEITAFKVSLKEYNVFEGRADLYVYFIEKGIKLLKEGGYLGFIVPNKFFAAGYGRALRKYILANCNILRIVDVSSIQVFSEASVYPVIIILQKCKQDSMKSQHKMQLANVYDDAEIISGRVTYKRLSQKVYVDLVDESFLTSIDDKEYPLIKKIKSSSRVVSDDFEVAFGIKTGDNAKYITKNKGAEYYYPLLSGKNCSRYTYSWDNDYIKYIRKELDNPLTKEVLIKPKIILRDIGQRPLAVYDDKGYFCLNTLYIIYPKNKEVSLKYLLGILNSSLINYYYHKLYSTAHISGGYLRFFTPYVKQIPIKFNEAYKIKIIDLVEKIENLYDKLSRIKDKQTDEKVRLEKEIQKLDNEIDEEVYKLYGITDEEKKIIEESLK